MKKAIFEMYYGQLEFDIEIYYAKIENSPIYDLLRQANINTENQLMVFSG